MSDTEIMLRSNIQDLTSQIKTLEIIISDQTEKVNSLYKEKCELESNIEELTFKFRNIEFELECTIDTLSNIQRLTW